MKISVITPVYNGERFIDSCIRSVIDQNCPDIEHLIVDGGSADRTIDIVKSHAEKHSQIRWLSERDNGQSDAMNKGIRLARGELIGFLNADDFYEPDTLNTALKICRNLPQPTLLIGNCNVIDEQGKLLWLNKPDTRYYQLLQVWRFKMPNNPSSYFYHRSLHDLIGDYDVRDHYSMDYDFLLKAFRAANVVYVDKTFGNYRMYPGNKTTENFSTGAGWDMVCHISRRYAAERGRLYQLHVGLGIALLRETLKEVHKPSLAMRIKWRLMRDCLKVFDKFVDAIEVAEAKRWAQ